jgi:hypothetical protein
VTRSQRPPEEPTTEEITGALRSAGWLLERETDAALRKRDYQPPSVRRSLLHAGMPCAEYCFGGRYYKANFLLDERDQLTEHIDAVR